MLEWLGWCYGGPAAAFPSGWRCSQCRLADAGVPAGGTGRFDELPVGTLRFSGRLAEYKRQFRRAFRCPDDDPSIFAIEVETLARRVFADINYSIQLQMVQDRFIDGQAECALRRHLDSVGPNAPMQTIVESCRVWESHNEAGVRRHNGSGEILHGRFTGDKGQSEMLDEVIRRLLPTPTVPPLKVAPIPSDCEMLIQRLLGIIRPLQPVIQERSQLTDMEIAIQNLLPVSSVVEEEGPSSEPIVESLVGCFSCGDWDHETDRYQELDESFMPVGWQADRIGDDFILRPGPTGATEQQAGNVD